MASPGTLPGGLTAVEAKSRLATEGYNDLPSADRRTLLLIVRDVLREPMFALLLGAGAIYLLLGDLGEALVLLAFATLSVGITIVQEQRSERVLDALRDIASPRALVVRDGERVRIPGREVARGDLLILLEGDRVPADGVVVSASELVIDESLLTGESVAVHKLPAEGDPEADRGAARPGGEGTAFVYSGTLVVRGEGAAVVRATGVRSELGRIGQSLRGIAAEPPRLQTETRRLVRIFAVVGLVTSLLVVVLYGLAHGDWLQGLLGGIAVGMSMLPEEFPLVLTEFMVMGAWRLSRARVLTRRAATIEMLGAATVLCTDKTGTLTENRMTVVDLVAAPGRWSRGSGEAVPADLHGLVAGSLAASAPHPSDPMERAIASLAADSGIGFPAAAPVRRYGLTPHLLAVTQAWQTPGAPGRAVFAKGAPEAIAGLCRLDEPTMGWLRDAVDGLAAAGTRVLAVARARHDGESLPETPVGFGFELLGLVGFADPLRSNVPDAIAECRSAGIRVAMVTGDYPATAKAIARQAGLVDGGVTEGTALKGLAPEALRERVGATSVFARILPEQKLDIVEAFKARGEIVAMTGDGVNDAPALRAAHIGVAMGGRGTDVAREASSIVLLDDDFGSIVRTIRLGRRIYDNLRKASAYIVAVHVPIAGLALVPLLMGLPLMLSPIHIAFLEMVIDPACSIVFEAETSERDLMKRPPRAAKSRLLSPALGLWALLQGALALAALVAVLLAGVARGMPDDELRALMFTSLVLINVGLILINRSFSASPWQAIARPNPFLWGLLALVAAILSVALYWPPAMTLFRFGTLHLDDLAMSLAAGLVVVATMEAVKPLWRVGFRT